MRLPYIYDDLSYSEREDLLDTLAEARFRDRRDRELVPMLSHADAKAFARKFNVDIEDAQEMVHFIDQTIKEKRK
jgi:hypothetical protein